MTTTPKRERGYCMVSRSVLLKLRCPQCVHLYALLDEEQGDRGRPVRGKNRIERDTGWDHRTVKRHIDHLTQVGLVEVRGHQTQRGGWSHLEFHVAHNPARGRKAELREVAGVWSDPPPRRTPRSRWPDDGNALRDVEGVRRTGAVDEARRVLSVGEYTAGAHRVQLETDTACANDELDGRHAMSSVSRSPRYDRYEPSHDQAHDDARGARQRDNESGIVQCGPQACPNCGHQTLAVPGCDSAEYCQCPY